jgi:hypothetical protein
MKFVVASEALLMDRIGGQECPPHTTIPARHQSRTYLFVDGGGINSNRPSENSL